MDRGPQSRSEIMYNIEDTKGTVTADRSPVVKDCRVMMTVYMDCHHES